MVQDNHVKIFLILFMTLAVVGILPVLAVNTDDSPQWQNNVNYAALTVRTPTDCTNYGGNIAKDGVCDGWKINSGPNAGLHINFTSSGMSTIPVTYQYNLSCIPGNTIANDPTGLTVCPDPNKKDIYVELDWMTGQGPDPQAIADVVKAFDKQGIALHIQAGEDPANNSGDIGLHYCDIAMVLGNSGTPGQACTSTNSPSNIQSYPYLKSARFGTVSERAGDLSICPNNSLPTGAGRNIPNPYSYNCLTAKRQVFHYAMLVNYQAGSVQTSGWSEAVGNDFVVSLGNFQNGKGSIDEQEGAIMHELGHNFGLHHGGMASPTGNDADDNCKPNYLSVMSYTYEFRENFDVCRPLDYSGGSLTSLNESSLLDSNIGSSQYPSDNPPPPPNTVSGQPSSCPTSGERKIIWSGPNGNVPSTTGVTNDWNQNGGPDRFPYSLNLNNVGIMGCGTATLSTLNGFNDWNFIKTGYNGSPPVPALIFRSSTNFYQGTPQANQSADVGGGYFVQESNQGNQTMLAPTITMPVSSSTYTTSNIAIEGTSTPSSTVTLYSGQTIIGTLTADNGGKWSTTISLGNGAYAVTATATLGTTTSSQSLPVDFTVNVTTFDFLPYVIAAVIIGIVTAIGIVSIIRSK